MNRKQFIYFTDWTLMSFFILSGYTGIELHLAGHGDNHEIWHHWALFHTVASLCFAVSGLIHIQSHWAWYKGLKTAGCKGKKKIVLLLSALFLSTVCTGVFLLVGVDGAHSPAGLLHYQTGMLTGVLGVFHLLKRRRFLQKGLTTNATRNKTNKKNHT